MNDNYIYDYISSLETIFSYGYIKQYSTSYIERALSYSSYIQRIENDFFGFAPIIFEGDFLKEIYKDVDNTEIIIYKQCAWASEAYIRIQKETGLTFEAIFLYIPLKKMYDYYLIYHEMDFSQIVDHFKTLYQKKSILDILTKERHIKLKEVSLRTKIPYDSLRAFKQRKRNIKNMNIEHLAILSRLFRVRMETLAEVRLQIQK